MSRNTSISFDAGDKPKSALSELLLKPSQSDEDYVYDYDFKILPVSADGNTQYVVFKKDLDIYFKNLLSEEKGF